MARHSLIIFLKSYGEDHENFFKISTLALMLLLHVQAMEEKDEMRPDKGIVHNALSFKPDATPEEKSYAVFSSLKTGQGVLNSFTDWYPVADWWNDPKTKKVIIKRFRKNYFELLCDAARLAEKENEDIIRWYSVDDLIESLKSAQNSAEMASTKYDKLFKYDRFERNTNNNELISNLHSYYKFHHRMPKDYKWQLYENQIASRCAYKFRIKGRETRRLFQKVIRPLSKLMN